MNGIDHLMSVVPDLAAAADAARRLGFSVTERGVHTGRGTSNHLIVLPGCYWELLAVDEPTPVNARVRDALAQPGLFGCALSTNDVAHDRLRTESAGLRTDAPVGFVRPLELDGVGRAAGFRTAQIHPDAPFDGYFFFCQHLTPELVWQECWMDHPNGALAITGVEVSAPDPAAAGALLGRLFGVEVRPDGDRFELTLGAIGVSVSGNDRAKDTPPRFRALRIAVADLDRLAASFVTDALPARREQRGLIVEIAALGDTAFVFEQVGV